MGERAGDGGREGGWGRKRGREGGSGESEGRRGGWEGSEGKKGNPSEAYGTVGHHLGVTSLNVELRNYVISRQNFIERRVT